MKQNKCRIIPEKRNIKAAFSFSGGLEEVEYYMVLKASDIRCKKITRKFLSKNKNCDWRHENRTQKQ